VSLLLADTRIDPIKPRDDGIPSFFIACENGHKEVVSLLLADPRIDLNKPRNDQSTPLWFASQNGHLVVVQHLLASGREIDTKMRSTFNNLTAAEHRWVQGPPSPRMKRKNFSKERNPTAPSAQTLSTHTRAIQQP